MNIMTLYYCNKPLFDPNLITAILLCFEDKLTKTVRLIEQKETKSLNNKKINQYEYINIIWLLKITFLANIRHHMKW